MRALLSLLALLALSACSTGSRDRACDPFDLDSCPDGARCVITVDGAPACQAATGDLDEGARCEDPAACGPGMGCVQMLGVPRCLRFCDTAERPDPCGLLASIRPGGALPTEVRAAARCLLALPDRPDVGACAVPCRFGAGDCPQGTSCGPSEAFGMAVCQPQPADGAALGEPCGAASDRCGPGLVCADLGVGRVCMRPADPTCDAETSRTSLPIAASSTDGEPPAVCAPCVQVGRYGDQLGTVIGLCLSPVGPDATDACAGDRALACACAPFGHPADLSDDVVAMPALATALGVAVDLRGLGATQPWVDARRLDGGWQWQSGAPVTAAQWAPGEPGRGDCAALGTLGLMSRDCGQQARVLCRADDG